MARASGNPHRRRAEHNGPGAGVSRASDGREWRADPRTPRPSGTGPCTPAARRPGGAGASPGAPPPAAGTASGPASGPARARRARARRSARRAAAGGRPWARARGARAGSGGRRNAGVRAPSRREASEHCTIPFAMNPEPSVVAAVRRFVEQEVRPVAPALEHADAYPHALVARMRELGLFGALVPHAYGGLDLDVTTYARVIEELCRGWMSLAGVINSHTMAALIVLHHGTEGQPGPWLPPFPPGEEPGGLCLNDPHAGSDVQAILTRARRVGEEYRISGTKMFVTNGREGNTFALLAVTDPGAQPRHRGMSCFIV